MSVIASQSEYQAAVLDFSKIPTIEKVDQILCYLAVAPRSPDKLSEIDSYLDMRTELVLKSLDFQEEETE